LLLYLRGALGKGVSARYSPIVAQSSSSARSGSCVSVLYPQRCVTDLFNFPAAASLAPENMYRKVLKLDEAMDNKAGIGSADTNL
jgi:hypothetical protein